MSQLMPNIVLKRKRLSKTKTVVIFQRNNLSLSNFKRTETGYIFEESFKHYEAHGYIKLTVTSDNIYDIFSVNTKDVKIRGGKDSLGIFLRFEDQERFPLNKVGKKGCIMFELNCEGKRIFYDNNKKGKKSTSDVDIHSTSKSTSIDVPASVSWAASHPFRGGGVNPR